MKSFSLTDNLKEPLDHKLDKLFGGKTNGFYIELGANDGLTQSNTAFFSFFKNWKGVLIEPSVYAYNLCVKNRPESYHFNCACVSSTYQDEYVSGDFTNGHLMSSVNGNRLGSSNVVKVRASTLTKILDSISPAPPNIDLLSLDVEGYEINVLEGLDFDKYRPNYMLIEVYKHSYDNIVQFLSTKGYDLHSNFSNYNKIDHPGWDGTHNDYLFIDTRMQNSNQNL